MFFKEVTDDFKERKGVKVRPALAAAGKACVCEEWRIKDQLLQSGAQSLFCPAWAQSESDSVHTSMVMEITSVCLSYLMGSLA